MGRQNRVLLRTICLPEKEPVSGSSCFTSGINRDSKVIDPVQLNLFNHTYCDKHRKGFNNRLKSGSDQNYERFYDGFTRVGNAL